MAEAQGRLLWLLPLVAAAIGFGAGRSATTGPASRDADAHPAQLEHAIARATRAKPPATLPSRAANALPPVPAADLPLADAFDALAARARAGDASASLRLLREIGHCVEQPSSLGFQSEPANDAQSLGNQVGQAEIVVAQIACPNITPDELATAGEWLERAAESGDPGAALCYVMLGTSDRYLPDRYSDEWIAAMQRYRTTARMYADRAFDAGYPIASWYLYDAVSDIYSTGVFQVDRDIEPDFERAYALAMFSAGMSAGHGGDESASWETRAMAIQLRLSDVEIARAKQWADAEIARAWKDDPSTLPCDLPR